LEDRGWHKSRRPKDERTEVRWIIKRQVLRFNSAVPESPRQITWAMAER